MRSPRNGTSPISASTPIVKRVPGTGIELSSSQASRSSRLRVSSSSTERILPLSSTEMVRLEVAMIAWTASGESRSARKKCRRPSSCAKADPTPAGIRAPPLLERKEGRRKKQATRNEWRVTSVTAAARRPLLGRDLRGLDHLFPLGNFSLEHGGELFRAAFRGVYPLKQQALLQIGRAERPRALLAQF